MKESTGTNLSKAETKIMTALAMKFSYKEIASYLNISINTVKKHTKNIYRKLGVAKRAAAIEKYLEKKQEEEQHLRVNVTET
jgi:LuxR family maltose regulon positive regulatory protein